MLNQAREFARRAHADQRYGDLPYVCHLDAVAVLLEPYGKTAQVIGYLHDVVEDTPTRPADIEALFGKFIADCVAVLTDEPDAGRAERKAKACETFALVTGALELALIVKTADRLANVAASVEQDRRGTLDRYRAEHRDFRAAAYRPGLCDGLWARLEAFLED